MHCYRVVQVVYLNFLRKIIQQRLILYRVVIRITCQHMYIPSGLRKILGTFGGPLHSSQPHRRKVV